MIARTRNTLAVKVESENGDALLLCPGKVNCRTCGNLPFQNGCHTHTRLYSAREVRGANEVGVRRAHCARRSEWPTFATTQIAIHYHKPGKSRGGFKAARPKCGGVLCEYAAQTTGDANAEGLSDRPFRIDEMRGATEETTEAY